MSTDFAEILWLVCNLTTHCWCRILLKSDVVCQSYGNVHRVTLFLWTRCRTFVPNNKIPNRGPFIFLDHSSAGIFDSSWGKTLLGLYLGSRSKSQILTKFRWKRIWMNLVALSGILLTWSHVLCVSVKYDIKLCTWVIKTMVTVQLLHGHEAIRYSSRRKGFRDLTITKDLKVSQ